MLSSLIGAEYRDLVQGTRELLYGFDRPVPSAPATVAPLCCGSAGRRGVSAEIAKSIRILSTTAPAGRACGHALMLPHRRAAFSISPASVQ